MDKYLFKRYCLSVDGERFDELLHRSGDPSLLQSFSWGNIQSRHGWEVHRLLLGDGTPISLQVTSHGPWRWGYIPRSRVPSPAAISELEDFARALSLSWLRFEPEYYPNMTTLTLRGYTAAPSAQPLSTLILPLSDPDSLLASFKPKHRYNIRLAAKKGVTIEESDDITILSKLCSITARRQNINLPSGRYFQDLLGLPNAHLYVAKHEDKDLAAIMVVYFGTRAYYLYGGSSDEGRSLMPNYAIQWQAIQDALKAGCKEYDFWGLPPSEDPNHPWHGLWQFKIGFGGEVINYPGAFDHSFSATAHTLAHLSLGPLALARKLKAMRATLLS